MAITPVLIRMHARDNVAIVGNDGGLPAGTLLAGGITLIDKLPQAVDWLTAQGVRFAPGGIRKGAAGFDICFLHPKSNDEFPGSRLRVPTNNRCFPSGDQIGRAAR